MLKTLLPAAKKFLSTLPKNFKLVYHKTRKGVFSVIKNRSKIAWKSKVLFVLAALVTFLFVNPSIGAQTFPQEQVVPAQTELGFVTVTDVIGVEKIPEFAPPFQGYTISTYFSKWHQGIDIPDTLGTLVKPLAEGVVTFAGWSPLGYGNLVTVRHSAGYESLYAHLANVQVKVGDQVTSATIIGAVGRTGQATGPHLHLEVHLDNVPVNPLSYLSIDTLLGK